MIHIQDLIESWLEMSISGIVDGSPSGIRMSCVLDSWENKARPFRRSRRVRIVASGSNPVSRW